MTDKYMEKDLSWSADDEQLVQAFFADCQVEIPDEGFSDRVMAALPVERKVRWDKVWLAFCLFSGVVAFVFANGWGSLQDWLYSLRIGGMMGLARMANQLGGTLSVMPTHLLMVLAGIATLVVVWVYNEAMDARARY